MTEWTVGQAVVVAENFGNRVELRDAMITKIGRKWITATAGHWSERFGFDGRGDRNWGHRPRMWSSREAYEAHVQCQRTWSEFQAAVRQSVHAPAHLSTEQIAAMLAAVRDRP